MDALLQWGTMKVLPNRIGAAKVMAQKVYAGRDHYLALSEKTGVPWYVVGVIHARESDCDFDTHLHNGDPLSRRTRHDPAGRPKTGSPPFDFDDSALDALECDHFLNCSDWNFQDMADRLEKYNGLGYRYKGMPSPYLWAGSDQYVKGKYVSDGVFDADTVDNQTGCMVILKCLAQLDTSVDPLASVSLTPVARPIEVADSLPPPSTISVAVSSKTVRATVLGAIWMKIVAVGSLLSSGVDWVFGNMPAVKQEADAQMALLKGVTETAHINWDIAGAWIGVSCLTYAVLRHVDLKKWLATGGVNP